MHTDPSQLVDEFHRLKVLVVGDSMLDSYSSGPAGRLCPEAPVPIVDVTFRSDLPGGAANSALNLYSLGATPVLVSVTGEDAEGLLLRQILDEQGVATSHLIACSSRRTLAKHRISAGAHMLVRFDAGTTAPIDEAAEEAVVEQLWRLAADCDAIVVSDYGYGMLTPRVIACLAELQRTSPRVLVVDSKRLAAYRDVGITAAKPNCREAMKLLGVAEPADACRRWETVASHSDEILDLTGAHLAAVTLDREGALLLQRGLSPYRTYARPAPDHHAAGAGDTFLCTLTLALAAGAPPTTAAEVASAAAGVVVIKEHTATCTASELVASLRGDGQPGTDLERLLPLLKAYRRQGKRIVLTGGCFDILHRGHIMYLNRAKSLGDILIVGVNTDESVRRLKGPERPINSLEDRLRVLSALSCIDHLVPFGEDTPHKLIEGVRPDVFVKGGDYTRETLPEAELVEQLGGTVRILPFLPSRSTTNLIERICQSKALAFPGDDDHVSQPVGRRQKSAVR
jgi:D-beta-D-heptose 7-phosphate kinase/D-beta-D-heptose 1-phosphate adenosyltransferase